ncbi:acyl-CoA dehydrogenase [Actinoalloteichus sp. AHMU CJ021]|uniref:acyl-CoA dehydrogenase family protein n=2 Tax=Pseudonocardiaceae TaxID=2070 RepID=UPI000413DBC5|nr:acyl-CoA dehydrogenase family protein [Actinoalloteichus caeruleus]AUS81034.1 acyl-CoA dehydrogenase [Actinoalloteichus sp. AHMU CJ021]
MTGEDHPGAEPAATHWLAVADEVARTLAGDAVEREQANEHPLREVALLRDAGLLALLVPAEAGGAGHQWPLAHQVLRRIAAADASVGHLLGYHWFQLWRTRLFDRPDLTARLERNTAEDRLFWAGVSNPRDAALALTPTGRGWRVTGRKSFATGASVADRLVVSGTEDTSGRKLTFVTDAADPGIHYLGDWDNLGQRLSASGGVEFRDVLVHPDDVLGAQPEEDGGAAHRQSLAPLGFQLLLSQLHVGIAHGALTTAAGYTTERTRAWSASGVERAVDDPHVLAGYGGLTARVEAAACLVDTAAEAFDAAAAAGQALDAATRGRAALRISQAKVVSTEVVNAVTTEVFELTGARATANRYGLDRFWRNARTITLHDPVKYKAAEIGRHLLTGHYPPVTGYS